jgi:dienelactone hydrolase
VSAPRALLLEKIGRLPAPRPAGPREVDRRFVWDGIVFERWRFTGPRDALSAWFLVPQDAPPRLPAVLALHPHGRQFELGKSLVAGLAGDASRGYGLAAARAGFAVLAPDLPGFEDRRPPLPERKNSYALQGEGYERLLAVQALVEGSTLQAWILADVAACLDRLSLDPRVDPDRIGAIGQSFGGQEVVFGMAFDQRLRAGVCSCGFSLVRLLVERRLSHNLALYLPGMLPDLDLDTIVAGIAPRPLRIIAGREDPIFPVEGVRAVEQAARGAWERAGAGDRLRFVYTEAEHDLPAQELEASLRWLIEVLA